MDPFRSSKRARSHPPKSRNHGQQQHANGYYTVPTGSRPPSNRKASLSHDDLPTTDPTSPRSAKLAALQRLYQRFDRLVAAFKFPHDVTFKDSATEFAPKLDYAAPNVPVHAHEEALMKIMIELDGVESDGDLVIRDTRKKLVRMVEEQLTDLDQMKREAFKQSLLTASKTSNPDFHDATSAKAGHVIKLPNRNIRNCRHSELEDTTSRLYT
ncbi:hypothetical protein OIO90_006345 [Microbotryomycetes sp. JL221]|nr:hypothetical protein OIO90_006345 [Microbotryomycetes sp. JL221]